MSRGMEQPELIYAGRPPLAFAAVSPMSRCRGAPATASGRAKAGRLPPRRSSRRPRSAGPPEDLQEVITLEGEERSRRSTQLEFSAPSASTRGARRRGPPATEGTSRAGVERSETAARGRRSPVLRDRSRSLPYFARRARHGGQPTNHRCSTRERSARQAGRYGRSIRPGSRTPPRSIFASFPAVRATSQGRREQRIGRP